MRSSSVVTFLVALAAPYLAEAADPPHWFADDQSASASVPAQRPAAPAPANHPPPKTTTNDKELAKGRAERCRIHPGTCVQQSDSSKP